MELANEPDNNFVMFAVDGTVYKYDLALREMILSFKTVKQDNP